MGSDFDFKITKRADEDLDAIVSYIVNDLANPKAATDFMDALENRIQEACDYPDSGSLVNNKYLVNTEVRKK